MLYPVSCRKQKVRFIVMKTWIRWQDWATVVLGVVLVLAPWVLGTISSAFAVDAWFVGMLSIIVALLSLYQPRRFIMEWITLLLGVWLFLSPWLLSFTVLSGAAWIAWIIGLLLVMVSGWTLLERRGSQVGIPTK